MSRLPRVLCLLTALMTLASGTVASTAPVAARSSAPRAPELTGRVLDTHGRPVREPLLVRATEHRGAFDLFATVLAFAFAAPAAVLACLAKDSICSEPGATTARIGADGRFAVPVPSGVGDYDVSVFTGGATPKFLLGLTLDVPAEGVRVPDLRLWDPKVRVAARADGVAFRWDELPAEYAATAKYHVGLTPSRTDGTYGTAKISGTTAVVDDRDLEDVPGRAVVSAEAKLGDIKVSWLAQPVAYPAPAGRPLSRGRPCTVVVQAAAATRVPGCWLVNGKFGDSYTAARRTVCYREPPLSEDFDAWIYCGKRAVVAVTIDLGAVREIGEVRRIGCERCTVDVSANGVAWGASYSTATEDSAPLELPAGTRGRYVRISADKPVVGVLEPEFTPTGPVVGDVGDSLSPNDLAMSAEVAVWGPRPVPSPPAPRPTASPVRGGGGVPRARGRAEPDSTRALAAVAALLALTVVGGLGYVAGRRRRPYVLPPGGTAPDVWTPP